MIFVDSNVVSEPPRKRPHDGVMAWLVGHDAELALSTVAIAEIAFGIAKIRPDERATRLELGLLEWRRRFTSRIFGLTEDAALAYGEIMGGATRHGRPMSAPDVMIAAIAKAHGGKLATRKLADFEAAGVPLVSPWEF